MTISTTNTRSTYLGNGVTDTFSTTFPFLDSEYLVVILIDALGGETTLTLNTDYTVTGAGSPGGGSVVLTTPPAVGETLVIYRQTDLTQETDYISGDEFPSESHERALDKLTMIAQEARERTVRALFIPETDPAGLNMALPSQTNRAGTVMVFDENGEPIVGPDLGNVNTVAQNIANIGAVAGDINNVNTVATNIADVNTVATNIADVNTVAQNITDINTVVTNITDVNTVVTNIADVNTVAQNITDVNNVANLLTHVVYETVNDMVTSTSLEIGYKVRTLGYYAAGDGGGNNYEVVVAGTGAADGGNYINLTGTSLQAKALFGDLPNVKQFGAKGDNVADDTTAIQLALDTFSGVALPEGIYKVTSTLYLNDENFIIGSGRDSKIYAFFDNAAFRGRGVTPASGTNIRRFNGGGRDFYLEGPGKTFSNSIGLDLRGCSMFKWDNVLITRFNTGVYQGGGYSTYYNEFYGVDITTVIFGYFNDALGNENTVVGGRVTDCDYGTRDSDNSHNKYIGLAIETFTIAGHYTVAPATTHIQFIGSRLENPPTSGSGVVIDVTAQDTVVVGAACIGLSSNITDSGIRSVILSTEHFNFSGTKIVKHQSVSAAINFPSIGAGATNDQFVSISGALSSDSVFVTPDPSVGINLMFMAIPANGGVYVRAANISGSTIDPPSLNFKIDIWRH